MGKVYQCRHPQTGERVAVKTLHPNLALQPEVVARFFNEAQAVRVVGHPGVVRVIDTGRFADGTAYMVMEYLEGETLSRLLQRGPLGNRALRYAREIADAIGAAHRRGITHRDIKPDNVMIVPDPSTRTGERVKVLDFGIAKIARDEQLAPGMRTVQTKTGIVMGTPHYMAPEQCRGASNVGPKADVYSLGCVLYELFSGRPPFTGQGLGEILAKHIYEHAPALAMVAPQTPPELSALVAEMMAKDPEQRPDMEQVNARLGAIHSGRIQLEATLTGNNRAVLPAPAPHAAGASVTEPVPKSGGRGARVAFIVGGAALLLTVGVLALSGLAGGGPAKPVAPPSNPAPDPPPPAPGARKIVWLVKSDPSGATVIRREDGKVLGTTPWYEERTAEKGTVDIALSKSGYVDAHEILPLDQSTTLHLKLDAQKRGRDPTPKPPVGKPPGPGKPPTTVKPPGGEDDLKVVPLR
jgi:serine/threonine-protein kinase